MEKPGTRWLCDCGNCGLAWDSMIEPQRCLYCQAPIDPMPIKFVTNGNGRRPAKNTGHQSWGKRDKAHGLS